MARLAAELDAVADRPATMELTRLERRDLAEICDAKRARDALEFGSDAWHRADEVCRRRGAELAELLAARLIREGSPLAEPMPDVGPDVDAA